MLSVFEDVAHGTVWTISGFLHRLLVGGRKNILFLENDPAELAQLVNPIKLHVFPPATTPLPKRMFAALTGVNVGLRGPRGAFW